MANTERLNTLQKVRENRKKVDTLLADKSLTPAQEENLNKIYKELVSLEDKLVLKDLKKSIPVLKRKAKRLKELASKIKSSAEKLKKIAADVKKVAKTVGTLADILAKATSVGIL